MKEKLRYYFKVFSLSVLPSFLLFFVLTFPYGELSNLVTTQVAKATGNQVLLEFKDMGFQIFPSLGLQFDDVNVSGSMLPELSMDKLEVSPSIMGLLSLKPGVRVSSQGLYGGNLLINTKGSEQNAKGVLKHNIAIELSEVFIGKVLKEVKKLPVKIDGKLNLDLSGEIDPSMTDEPDLKLDFDIKPFKIAGGNINTGVMGEIILPAINLKSASFRGSLKQNKLRITEFVLGSTDEAVRISLKGSLDIRLQANSRGIVPSTGQYDLDIEINAGPAFENDFGLYLGFLEQYKRPQANRNLYKFNISGLNFRRPPQIK